MIRLPRLLLLVLLPVLTAAADAGPAEDGWTAFQRAYRTWDGPGFAHAAGLFHQAATAEPQKASHHAWLGSARFHEMLWQRDQAPGAARDKAHAAAMAAAERALEESIRLDPTHAESHAMLATLHGMKIAGSTLRALRHGPAVQRHFKLAQQHGPNNPRVAYLHGAALFHTAKNAADRKAALQILLRAEKLYLAEASQPAKPGEARWGLSTCRTFIGRCHEQLSQHAQAEKYYRLALHAHPADRTAREGLARVTRGRTPTSTP